MSLFIVAASSKPTVWEKVKASLREFNEFAPWIALVMVGGSVILYWTYERTEPKVFSPIINELSKYLPTRIPYKEAPEPT